MSQPDSPQAPISLASPAIVGPAGENFVCVVGVVRLLPGSQGFPPGSLVGVLTTALGSVIVLVQSSPVSQAGVTLPAVNGQVATVCGNLAVVQGQLVLDVRFVSPGLSPSTPGVNPLALLLFQILAGAPR